jgi:hypothetical protein
VSGRYSTQPRRFETPAILKGMGRPIPEPPRRSPRPAGACSLLQVSPANGYAGFAELIDHAYGPLGSAADDEPAPTRSRVGPPQRERQPECSARRMRLHVIPQGGRR